MPSKKYYEEHKEWYKEYHREYYLKHKEKINKQVAEYRRNNPEKAKNTHWKGRIKRLYGITEEEYNNLLQKQNNTCAICNKVEISKYEGILRKLSVDHDHITGKVRGLLCDNCNRGIGHLQEDVDILKQAIKYVCPFNKEKK